MARPFKGREQNAFSTRSEEEKRRRRRDALFGCSWGEERHSLFYVIVLPNTIKKLRSSKVHMYHHKGTFWILSSNPAPSEPTSLFPPPLSLFSSPFDAGIRGGFNAPFFFPLLSSHGDFSSDISISLFNKMELFDARRIIGGISSGFWATFPSSKKVTNRDHNSIFYDVFSSHLDPFFLQVTILFSTRR